MVIMTTVCALYLLWLWLPRLVLAAQLAHKTDHLFLV